MFTYTLDTRPMIFGRGKLCLAFSDSKSGRKPPGKDQKLAQHRCAIVIMK